MLLIELQCLPPLYFFCEALKNRGLLIEQWENYQKRSFRNRIYLLGHQGTVLFTIPLKKGKNEQQVITQVQISYDEDWPSQFYKLLKTCYGNSPYFAFYATDVMDVIKSGETSLFQLNKSLLQWSLQALNLDWDVSFTAAYSTDAPEGIVDRRNFFTPNKVPTDINYMLDYAHVFDETNTFTGYLSCIDLIFCAGPEAPGIIQKAVESPSQ